MNQGTDIQLLHGGHKGAETEFGIAAEAWGVAETTLSFEGHKMERARNVRVLGDDELAKGQVSMEFVFHRMGRRFAVGHGLRRVIQSMFHLVVGSDELFAIGWILPDDTVKGGTGWGVELAKVFNRRVHVFDQEKQAWFSWTNHRWEPSEPRFGGRSISVTGTRNLTEAGKNAIQGLFERSLGKARVTASVR